MTTVHSALLTRERESDLEPPARCELQVVLSGVTGRRRVLHATGPMSEAGARLLTALVEQSVRKGCTYLRLDLAGVTDIDVAALRMLHQFQAEMGAIGVTVRFTDPYRRTTHAGLTSLRGTGPAVRL